MAKTVDRIEIYKSRRNGQYGWRYIAGGNNARIAVSGETYLKLDHAKKMVARLFPSVPVGPIMLK